MRVGRNRWRWWWTSGGRTSEGGWEILWQVISTRPPALRPRAAVHRRSPKAKQLIPNIGVTPLPHILHEKPYCPNSPEKTYCPTTHILPEKTYLKT